jgi:predicted RNA-binding protein associated with RNAse of E/G family
MGLQVGDLVQVRFTKWGGGGHWEFPLRYLGADEHGHWAAGDVGTRLSRPAMTFESAHAWVTLFPHDQPWSAAFYDWPAQPTSVYVDMTTVPEWSDGGVTMVDLDLDVVLRRDGSLFVDDEDEFDEHRVALDYPQEIVDLARGTADAVLAAVSAGQEPFATVGHRWLQRAVGAG